MSLNPPGYGPPNGGLQGVESLQLWSRCARDTTCAALWTELLRRFTPKINMFIKTTLRQSMPSSPWKSNSSTISGGAQESDLFQMTIVKLVQNDCAAMTRFSGSSEADLIAYLAVITRSVVRDFIRRQIALKRPPSNVSLPKGSLDWLLESAQDRTRGGAAIERNFLARELSDLTKRTLDNLQGQFSHRDKLIFEMYFFDGLSPTQISRCEGIHLTKRGVEEVLSRLKGLVRTAAAAGLSEAITK
jgi:RNA polymerase sigma factor (sigma-70 family)